jgi:hypothetical protein
MASPINASIVEHFQTLADPRIEACSLPRVARRVTVRQPAFGPAAMRSPRSEALHCPRSASAQPTAPDVIEQSEHKCGQD